MDQMDLLFPSDKALTLDVLPGATLPVIWAWDQHWEYTSLCLSELANSYWVIANSWAANITVCASQAALLPPWDKVLWSSAASGDGEVVCSWSSTNTVDTDGVTTDHNCE